MEYIFKKIHVAITALLLTLVSQVHADDNLSTDGQCGDSCSCAPVCCAPCGKGFISADLLYWRAFEGGLDECFPTEDIDYVHSYGDIISKFRGKGEDFHFQWDAGFRLGAGYEFGCGWDIAVYWTHFHSNSRRNGNQHRCRWKLDFEVVDLIAGRPFDLGSCFTVRPFGGLRVARIEQKLRTNFRSRTDSYVDSSSTIFMDDLSLSGYSSSHFKTASAHGKNRLLGTGPLIGIEGDWNLGCGFSLYANASFAVLYGHFHVRLKESEEFVDGANFSHIKRNPHACQAVVDAGLGVRWQTSFCGNIVWLQLGLEHHRYFNQNRMGEYGDLCLDGANFSAGIAY